MTPDQFTRFLWTTAFIGLALIFDAMIYEGGLYVGPAPPVQWVRSGFLHPAPTWPEIGTVRRVF